MRVPKLKLSDNYSNGSYSDRIKTAVDFNSQLFQKVYSLYENSDYASIRQIERIYKKFMPEPIFFSIKKLKKEEIEKWMGGFITYFCENKATFYRIVLPAKDNKLHISNLPTLMHESMHFFDNIINPKHLLLCEKLLENDLNSISNDLYLKYYYNNCGYTDSGTNKNLLKRTKKATYKAIKEMNYKDKLLILNSIKESLKGEINGFKETQKYAKKLQNDKRIYKRIDANGYHKSYQFEQKLDIVNSIIYEIITNERKNMRPDKSLLEWLILRVKSMF